MQYSAMSGETLSMSVQGVGVDAVEGHRAAAAGHGGAAEAGVQGRGWRVQHAARVARAHLEPARRAQQRLAQRAGQRRVGTLARVRKPWQGSR